MKRRKFLKQSGLISSGIVLGTMPAAASRLPLLTATTPDEKQSGALYERGKPTTYLKSKNELQYIGMPVGGIMCGMVYLGGDGRMWLWDVFNKNQTGVIYKDVPWHEKIQNNEPSLRPFDGANYVVPVKDIRPVEQGFALRFEWDGQSVTKKLHESDWDEIAFEATYPMATIRYLSKEVPCEVFAKVYSPFIPLNEEDSGLPATIYSFHLKNKSGKEVSVSIAGWLENKSSIDTVMDEQYVRVNTATAKDGMFAITGTTRNKNWADDNFFLKADYGNFCIASLNQGARINTHADPTSITSNFFTTENQAQSSIRFDQKAIASVSNQITLHPDSETKLNYVISWFFPNLSFHSLKGEAARFYSKKFKSATEVCAYVNANFERLSSLTASWCDAYYAQSTLPHWFLERTFVNTSTLATTTCHRFSSGRFYAWEGVGSCAGTCTHVWQYAQAMARIFPALERDTRSRVDLGVAFHDDGHIGFRGEYDTQPAIDGQAGRILGIYREHTMTTDNSFLSAQWPKVKKAVEYMLRQDLNGNGMVDSRLENTLDAKWPGEIAWLVGLCLAASKASELMAVEMGDSAFAATCKAFFDKGKPAMEKELFNGEYFIHAPDPNVGKTVIGSYNTCHIDQVYGQSWAFQAGMTERIIEKEKTLSALRALWKYNFLTDVGPYLKTHHGGRPYALPGEGGMLMNTNPKNDPLPYGVEDAWQVTYFHECMSGFEHQVAAHMMAEGMTDEALLLTKTVHDRYHAAKRNPFNEVECSDHYARAMASYGTYITACGFSYHGPQKHIRFAPKLKPDNFSAAFTTAEGWGTYAQRKTKNGWDHQLNLKYGTVELAKISLWPDVKKVRSVTAMLGSEKIKTTFRQELSGVAITFEKPLTISENRKLQILIV